MEILITGCGFIGSNLLRFYVAQGNTVYYTGRHGNLPGTYLGYDFDNLPKDITSKIDLLIHCAAITDTTVQDQDYMFGINTYKALSLFDQVAKAKVIYCSSAAVYGNTNVPFSEEGPFDTLSVYAESKLTLDRLVKRPAIGLRFSNVYGIGEDYKGKAASMIRQLYYQMLNGSPKLFDNGGARDFVYIIDILQAVRLAENYSGTGIFNIGSGVSTSFETLVEMWNKIVGINREITYIPNPHNNYQVNTLLDITKARTELGYEPKWTIEEGMRDYYHGLKEGLQV